MAEHVIFDRGEVASRIIVGRGTIGRLAGLVGERDVAPGQVAILCQPSTRDLAEDLATSLAGAGIGANGITLPDGESAKQIGVVEDVYRHLNREQFTRADLIIGVGGGALTDTAGFIGGTYLRGVDVWYVPTTLLGAVDAAIGGKTGVNVDGKNLAGVFKHPEEVLIDVDILDALSEALRREGSAEALKTGFIDDEEIIVAYERHGLDVDLEEVVDRAVAVKVRVVNADFTERGVRAFLNYGHTVGHAIETSTGRRHGESVAIGMHAAGAASAAVLGFADTARQRDVLRSIGLPTQAPDAKRATVRSLMALDKKRDAEGLKMVLLREIGAPEVHAVDDATVRLALDAAGVF